MTRLFLYILSFGASIIASTLLIIKGEYAYSTPTLVLAVISCVFLIKEYRSNTKKVTYMLNALENNDTSFRFRDTGGDYYNHLYIETLNRINEILSNEKIAAREQEKYFELMLSNVITGIVALNEKGIVYNCNEKALELIGLPVLTHVTQLHKVDDILFEAFTSEEKTETRSITIPNERGELHLSLKNSFINLRGEKIKIVAINDIGDELEEKEQDSWTRLIRVLTHEIMNTVTPISSLSDTLSMMVNQREELSEEDDKRLSQEIKQGLEVISLSSKGLISFVDSYRTLTRIPTPNLKPIYAKELIHRVLTLVNDDMNKASIVPQVSFSDDSIMLYADENLISQVIINIIKNALAAIGSLSDESKAAKKPFVRINVSIDSPSEDIILEIANNGEPIPKENQEHIFVPFFTTKNTGTGIGLSISRQIMRKHNGSLKLRCSNDTETAFVLVFK